MRDSFEFLKQTTTVQSLLEVCQAALDHLPADLREKMVQRLLPFEESAVVTMWSLGDVDPGEGFELTPEERRSALAIFARNQSVSETDELQLAEAVQQVVDARREVAIKEGANRLTQRFMALAGI